MIVPVPHEGLEDAGIYWREWKHEEFPFPMRGWKAGVPNQAVITVTVPVPHEGLEGRMRCQRGEADHRFPFPMRGWKTELSSTRVPRAPFPFPMRGWKLVVVQVGCPDVTGSRSP